MEIAPFDFWLKEIEKSEVTQRKMERVLACNETSRGYGLFLSTSQAEALLKIQAEVLRKTERIEWEDGILTKLILHFCDSPYLWEENYEPALQELLELFYHFKNETADRLSDADLLAAMKNAFDQECHGSITLLAREALPDFVRKMNVERAENCGKLEKIGAEDA